MQCCSYRIAEELAVKLCTQISTLSNTEILIRAIDQLSANYTGSSEDSHCFLIIYIL
jgi:hypothetical protein